MTPKKICLVTGASSGIGKEIATALAISGAQVIMVCRNATKGLAVLEEIKQKSGSKSIDLILADLSSQREIRLLAQTIQARYTQLDVLINNAGLVLSKKTFSEDGIEMTLALNHLAPFLLTNLLLDLLKKSAPARIINISSDIHKWGKIHLDDLQFEKRKYQFMKAYAQSKLLLTVTSFELARQLANSGVTLNCVHPGAVKTNLGSDSTHHILLKVIDKMIKFFFITPQKAAEMPFYLATSSQIENVTGQYYANGKPKLASSISYDTQLAKKIWEISEKLTQSISA